MYAELADWWHLISPVEDYKDEATFFSSLIAGAGIPETASLLELGSGGGSNAFFLKKHFAHTVLTDLSPQMLEVSRRLNPECEHVAGDMRTLRLGRSFDVVFAHDAIDYMTTVDELRQAIETAFVHCKQGGLALFIPDDVRETFASSTEHDGHDDGDRALRYLGWTYDPDPEDTMCVTEYVYLLRKGSEPARVEHDRHVCGLFPRATWLTLLREAGFEPKIVPDPFEREIFVGHKWSA
jgi:trans-aconitate methyltransferase